MQKHPGMTRREMLAISAGAAAGLVGCNSDSSPSLKKDVQKKPNLVFVFSDQQRRHALGFMNEDPVITPNLDSFAESGMVFINALSACPVCAPYRATLLTGRYPHSTGVIKNGPGLRPGEVTIGNVLKQSEYQTAYIGKWHLYDSGYDDWRKWHFNELGQFVPHEHRFGFDYWHVSNVNHRTFWKLYFEVSEEPVVNSPGWQPEHEVDTAIQYLKNRRKKGMPFAMFVSMVPPHNTHGPGFEHHKPFPGDENLLPLYRNQYAAPEKYEEPYRGSTFERSPNVRDNFCSEMLPGYFGACTGIDDQFGRLLRCLDEEGLADDTIVVYTSDHGEMMGGHDRIQKAIWHEESIGIPFLIRWPGRIKKGREDLLFNSVDVMPSLLGLMDMPIPESVEGTDFSGIMLGHNLEKPASAFIQCTMLGNRVVRPGSFTVDQNGTWKAIRTQRNTFVVNKYPSKKNPDIFFYDNEKDPYQLKPMGYGEGSDALMAELKRELKGWLLKTNDPFTAML